MTILLMAACFLLILTARNLSHRLSRVERVITTLAEQHEVQRRMMAAPAGVSFCLSCGHVEEVHDKYGCQAVGCDCGRAVTLARLHKEQNP